MTLDRFDEVCREHQLNKADFESYFEAEYLQVEGRGGFLRGGVMYGWDWRKYVQDDAFTETDLVEFWVKSYQHGQVNPLVPKQPLNVANADTVGLEIELSSIQLVPTSKKLRISNGMLLAKTKEKEMDLPVMKLEIEGMDRSFPSVELIYGPLQRDEYNLSALTGARLKLFDALEKKGLLSELVADYNKSLGHLEKRYRLVAENLAGSLRSAKPGEVKTNTQTNISIDYSAVGSRRKRGDFSLLFDTKADERVFAAARHYASEIDPLKTMPSVISLLTQFMYQEAKYLIHRIVRGEEEKGAKHHFHVMFKVSPQDAIMTILSDSEAATLLAWLWGEASTGVGQLVAGVKKAFGAASSGRSAAYSPEAVETALLPALMARVRAGRQLLEGVSQDWDPSSVIGWGGVASAVGHTHPRPTNRVPITVSGAKYYVVIEQRSSRHILNDPSRNARDKDELIRQLQGS